MRPLQAFSSSNTIQIVTHSLVISTIFSGAAAQDDSSRLRNCLTSATLLTTFSDASSWQTVTSPWSLRFNPEPAAVVVPRTRDDIAAALTCAVDAGVKVSPLNGGHSYGAYGLGGVDGALVLDMVHFTETTFDATRGLFT